MVAIEFGVNVVGLGGFNFLSRVVENDARDLGVVD